jgi:hypothetical protein
MSAPSPPSIFRWDTLREIGRDDLLFEVGLFTGRMLEVELTNGVTIRVWRADDGKAYFCHGLTFGGKDAPGGAVSPYTGRPVVAILRGFYDLIPEAEARAGDILVWSGIAPNTTPHSAVLLAPVVVPGKTYLSDTTLLRSKNGMEPEADTTLYLLTEDYQESYAAYRWR